MISPEDKFPLKPCLPVIQKRQSILQPTCEEMQSVARSLSGIKTASTRPPVETAKRYLRVPSFESWLITGAVRPTV